MTYTRVESSAAVQQLAAGLRDAARERPWVVVTSRFGSREPDILVDQLAEDVGDVTRIFLIETGALTHELSDLLPDLLQAYGGAGRSYPVGPDALADFTRSKLRFPYANPPRATEQLVTDALAHAHQAGLFARAPASAVSVTGTVKGFIPGGSRALVELAGGGLATIWQELTFPPVPLDWTLERGQRVDGLLDRATRRLNVEVGTPPVTALAARFPHNSITLALVQHVNANRAALALHPHAAIGVTRPDISPNPLDQVDTLLTEGDVVAVRVVHHQSGALHLRLTDVDDDEPVLPPLALVRNGPPWLRENRPLVPVIEPVPLVELALAPEVQPSEVERVETTLPELEPVETTLSEVEPVESRSRRAGDRRANPAAVNPAAVHPRPGPGVVRVFTPPAPMPRQAVVDAPAAPAVPASVSLQSTQLSLVEARARIRRLEAQLIDAGASDSQHAQLREQARTAQLQHRESLVELGTLRRTEAELRDEQRTQRRTLRESRRTSTPASVASEFERRRGQWADADGWVRHELYLAWVERIGATERAKWPLPVDYALSDAFADSLADLDDGQLAKAFKACVDVLTGRVASVPGRQLHALRTGNGATAAAVVRPDGARCMRVAIEQNTPAARRLHYWMLPGSGSGSGIGGIELARVVTHDDMEP
ncbi:hypothetical protein [Cryobacterium tagatosivorans]|uniref:S1 motif domain-containing protein n=1 Tax=Cryobacterium tagatosivorans TaxID=1259199 RepID=A0A4R8UBG1_9MICO|nr:hypothetical protein [Cryobacterium tagatosivorans]TFB46994.1 hypothetical protein E3O23_16120 [Cryobacterium tagatosivorans]